MGEDQRKTIETDTGGKWSYATHFTFSKFNAEIVLHVLIHNTLTLGII